VVLMMDIMAKLKEKGKDNNNGEKIKENKNDKKNAKEDKDDKKQDEEEGSEMTPTGGTEGSEDMATPPPKSSISMSPLSVLV